MSAVTPVSPAEQRSGPRHIAIVMDGNGRWAKARMRPRTIGHRAGARAVNRCIDWCLAQGVEALTLFAFSSENWRRPADEVSALMQLFMRALDREVDELARRGVRLRFIGDRKAFSTDLQQRMLRGEKVTEAGLRLSLTIAANYGGRWDIAQACRRVALAVAGAEMSIDSIDETSLAPYLALADLPAADLFIRTGGEQRISNFLLWQLAYCELYFTDTLWPDVDEATMDAAVAEYSRRERRFGLTSEQLRARSAP
ncbi:MAG: polyprenyl diphosphate synthase [Pseudomarimonas sp.]